MTWEEFVEMHLHNLDCKRRAQLSHVGKAMLRHIINVVYNLTLGDPQIAAMVLQVLNLAVYQDLADKYGEETANWITLPGVFSTDTFGKCVREYELRSALYILAVCFIFTLDPTLAIAQPAAPGFKTKLYAAMQIEVFQTFNRLQSGSMTLGAFVLNINILGRDFQLSSAVKVDANQVRIEPSWKDQMINPDCSETVQLTIYACIPDQAGLVDVQLGLIFIHRLSGAVRIALDPRCSAWESVEPMVNGKRIDIVQVKRGIHKPVISQLLTFMEEQRIPFSNLAATLYGPDLFYFQAAYLQAQSSDPDKRAQEALHKSVFYQALTKLGFTEFQIHVTTNSEGLATTVYVQAKPNQASQAVAA